MSDLARFMLIASVICILCGCSRQQSIKQPIPPPQVRAEEPQATYSYEHKIDPDPNYEPRDVDALAAALSGVTPVQAQPAAATTTVVVNRYRRGSAYYGSGYGYGYGYHDERYRGYRRGFSGDHYLNTIFWGGMGAVIGSASHHAGQGAIIGAAAGHMIDHGGVHGFITRDTVAGGLVGLGIGSLSGHAGRGALIGAVSGHLLDDVFRSRRDDRDW